VIIGVLSAGNWEQTERFTLLVATKLTFIVETDAYRTNE